MGFDVLATAFADVVGLVLEGLAHAGAEALGLDDGGHEERDVLEAAAVGHAAHGGAAHDAHANVVLHAAALVDERALHTRRDFRERGVEGKARLHTDAEQVEHLRQLVLNLLLAALDGRIEEDDGHEAAEETEQEDHHGLLYGRIGSRTDHHQGKEPHDDGAEQAAAEELGDAPLARLARKHDALLDDGAQPQRRQGRRQCAEHLLDAARWLPVLGLCRLRLSKGLWLCIECLQALDTLAHRRLRLDLAADQAEQDQEQHSRQGEDKQQLQHRLNPFSNRRLELAARKGDVVCAGGGEEAVGQLNAADLELLEEARLQAGRHEVTEDLAVAVEAGLLEAEDILRRDGRALNLLHLGDVGDFAAAVAQARLMDDQVDGRRDLLTDGALWQLEAGHHDHRLESREDVARAVGMGRRQRAVVARVHGLQHVERLARADLADDDAVGAHAQGIAHEVADGDGALALEVGRARLERHDVLLLKAQFSGILDGDDALALGDERRDYVERRRLTGASTARDEDIDARLDAGAQERCHLLVHRAEGNQVVDAKRRLGELADGQAWADERERRDDDVDTRAVLEARIDERRRFIDAAAKRRQNALDDVHEMRRVVELGIRQLELAHALDEDLARAIDHDLGDGIVLAQGLDRAEAEHFIADVRDEPRLLALRDGKRILVEHTLAVIRDERLDLMRVLMHRSQHELLLRRHLIDNALMDTLLDFLIRALCRHILGILTGTKNIDLTILTSRPSQARQ